MIDLEQCARELFRHAAAVAIAPVDHYTLNAAKLQHESDKCIPMIGSSMDSFKRKVIPTLIISSGNPIQYFLYIIVFIILIFLSFLSDHWHLF